MSPALRLGATLASLLALGSCLSRDVTEPHDNRATTLLVRADVSAAPGVASLVVEVTAPNITTPLVFNMPIAGGVATGTITVPAGSNRTITMHAFDAGGVETHRGSTTVKIVAGTNPIITLVLAPLAGDAPINATLGSFVVAVAPLADTLSIGGTTALMASIVDASATPVLQPVVWATLNPGIATVASTGDRTAQVTAVGAGVTTIVASFGGSGGPATIVVSPNPTLQLVTGGLDSPTYVTQAPGDTSRLYVVNQSGWIRVVHNGVLLPTPFLDLRGQVSAPGERGLLSMAFHPDYAVNGWFFIYFTDLAFNIRVVRYTVTSPDVADVTSAQPILSVEHATFTNHNGGLALFGPDGYLYVGLGDGGGAGDPLGNAKDSTKLLGKLLRLDVNGALPYTVPAGNPFVGRPPAAPEVWAYGLRNPWRFSFDRVTHDLYIADVGQNVREEVDVQAATSTGGENYGWNVMEGAVCYPPPTTGCSQAGLVLPTLEYDHTQGCSISGGNVYRGSRFPALVGHYFYSDFCTGWIRSFRYVNGTVRDQHDYTPELGLHPGIVSFGEDASGELYVVVRNTQQVYRIVPGAISTSTP
jgi:glucose/arabinose dehydrogenase